MFERELTFTVIAFILVVPTSVFLAFVSTASDAQAGSKVVEQGVAAVKQLQQMQTLETVPPNRTLPTGDLPTLEQVPPLKTLPGGGVGGIPTLQQQQGEPPLPVVCSEEAGLVKDPENGQCVPIVQPPPSPPRDEDAEQPEEPEEQSGEEESQSEDGGGDDSSSGDGVDGGNGNDN